jgi:tRNA (guanine-N7-)-methyltransferase
MSKGAQLRISKTRSLLRPNAYIQALTSELSPWAFDEEKILEFKGRWREHFGVDAIAPLDLEIGTGNGFHLAHYAQQNPNRSIVGLELKYKPLIQSIRRSLRRGSTNVRVGRYNAVLIHDLFAERELDRVFIHFPDPWEKVRHNKHRLIQDSFLARLFHLVKPGAAIEFKTDSRDYFEWTLEKITKSAFEIAASSFDLHQSPFAETNFVTHFEQIFIRKKQPIHFVRFVRPAPVFVGAESNDSWVSSRSDAGATN